MSVQTYCWCNGGYDKAKAEIATLKDGNERLQARVAELEAALSQYADDYNWCYDTCNISRNIAKDALEVPADE